MILYVNGIRKDATASLDLLTRAVVISLFTWRRAERDDRTPQPYGWWGDTWPAVQNDRIGSRLYLLKRRKLTNKTPQDAREYMQQALAWMTDDGVAARIDVTSETHRNRYPGGWRDDISAGRGNSQYYIR